LQGQFFNLLIAKYLSPDFLIFFALIPTRITKRRLKMQIYAEGQTQSLKPIPNPRGTQTVPQPKPATPRSPDGRFAPEFRPHPPQTKPEK